MRLSHVIVNSLGRYASTASTGPAGLSRNIEVLEIGGSCAPTADDSFWYMNGLKVQRHMKCVNRGFRIRSNRSSIVTLLESNSRTAVDCNIRKNDIVTYRHICIDFVK